jgi:hypothetical protein
VRNFDWLPFTPPSGRRLRSFSYTKKTEISGGFEIRSIRNFIFLLLFHSCDFDLGIIYIYIYNRIKKIYVNFFRFFYEFY